MIFCPIRNANFLSFERDQRFAVVIGVKKYTSFQTHCTRISNRTARQKRASHKGELPYLRITRCFEILPFKRCSAPATRYRCARLVALSSSSDKLASGNGDRWIYALVSLARATFEFLALAVRSWRRIATQA